MHEDDLHVEVNLFNSPYASSKYDLLKSKVKHLPTINNINQLLYIFKID